MKTAISVDEQLLQAADLAAREMGMSRSRLVAQALDAYLRARLREKMTASLNQVYADEANPAEIRTLRRMKTKFRSSLRDRW